MFITWVNIRAVRFSNDSVNSFIYESQTRRWRSVIILYYIYIIYIIIYYFLFDQDTSTPDFKGIFILWFSFYFISVTKCLCDIYLQQLFMSCWVNAVSGETIQASATVVRIFPSGQLQRRQRAKQQLGRLSISLLHWLCTTYSDIPRSRLRANLRSVYWLMALQ